MNQRTSKPRRLLAVLLALAMMLSILPTAVFAASPAYTRITDPAQLTSGQYLLVAEHGYAPGVLDGTWLSAVQMPDGDTITAPDASAVWTLAVTGSEVTLTDANGVQVAPKGGEENGIKAGEYSWLWKFENGGFSFCGQDGDPVTLASNKGSQNKFRAYKNTTVSGNPAGYPSVFALYRLEEGGDPGQTVAAPQADPQAGEVEKGTAITLTTATPGASIYYTLDGSDPTDTAAAQLYSADNRPVIEADCTLKAVAVLDGSFSAVQQLQYTVKEQQPAAPIADGDKVVIYAPAYGKALSSTYNGFYNNGVDVKEEGAALTGYTDAEVWTVIDNGDGSFSFAAPDGQKIGMGDSFSSMPLGEKNDRWVLEDAGNGSFYIKNTVRESYMEWYESKNNWSSYYNIAAGSEGMFALKFYKAEETQPAGPIADGDRVVIYAPAYNKALSTTYNGFYNNGVDVKEENGKLTGYTEAEVWTVIDNGDGSFSFAAPDGQKIGMGDSFSSMPLGEKNDRWVLEDAGDGKYYIKNTVRESYMEWYESKNNWSSYYKIAAGSEGMFALKFAKAEDVQPAGPIADGDKVVIYAPAYNKALSSTYNGFYNNGVDVKEESGKLTGYTNAEVWTVIDNGDGSYSFAAPDGQKIGMGDSFSSMPLGEKNDRWTLEDAGDGKYYVKNTVRGAYMEWYDKNNNWSAYGSIASGSEGMFALKFAKAEEVEQPEEPTGDALEVQASPKSGASVTAGDTVTLKAGKDAEIYFTMAVGEEPADPDVTNPDQKYTAPIAIDATPEKDKPITIKAVAYVPASEQAEAQTGKVYTFTYKAPMEIGDYQLYFGQLHSHTALSDGTGTVQQAFDHAAGVPNLDFLAVTDHSNWFEGKEGLPGSGTTHMGDADAEKNNAAWGEGRQAARDITAREDGTFVGIYGFEMTWSGGSPGHINTFNSKGFENRNAAPYKKGDNYEVLGAYFNTLNENPETISQFNHPGDTFGDFMDFALYDPITDNQMTLVEVGNGEGPIGGSGYFPSYSYYTRALDKGWHVAPTNNQDNHKGNWGDSNTGRSVVLAEDLTEESIYDAMKNYRVYATEDNDLSILYTLNGNAMGSILGDQDSIHIEAVISDPTDTAGTTRVEVIVNGGQVLAEDSFTGGSATVTFDDLSASYGYYYLRITQADKNIAVTAPVWVGESVNAGVSNTKSDVLMPIRGDKVNLSSQVFNNTGSDMTVKSLTYTIEGEDQPFHTADLAQIGTNGVVAPRTSVGYSFPYNADTAGGFNINVQLQVEIDGEQYTFTDVLKLSVSDPSVATRILVDGTHYNDYVNGYYAGNMTNFINMGTAQNIQVRIAQPGETITPEMLAEASLFVISAPLKYTSDYTGDAKVSAFEPDFIQMVADYVNGGGTVVVCGLADYQDGQLPYTSYQQANALLEGIGAKVRINDDELLDQEKNGGQPYRLYFDRFNTESTDPAVQQILAGVAESGLTYSSYSGCSVNVSAGGEPIVFGHDSTYSINSKSPAQGHDKPVLSYSDPYDASTAVVPKGEVVAMATEQVGEGRVYVSGTVFCSNFEVSAEDADSYANAIMLRNLMTMVKREPVISTILEARAGQPGEVFTVQGTVANGTAESGNAFFDTIYIQDEEGNGINVFPINDNTIRRGDRVQVTGSVSEYIGDKQLSAISVTTLEGTAPVVVTDMTTKEANDYAANFGKLVRVEGKVQKVELAGGKVETIILQDESGESCRVFIDGYIDYSDKTSPVLEEFVKQGATVSAMGFVSHDAVGNRLRVRDRSEIREGTAEPTVQFTVKVSVSGGSWNGPALATAGKDYTGTLTAASGYALPSSVTVTVAGKTLAKDAYTYDPATGKLTLPAAVVNGEITISVTCVQTPSPDQPGTGGGSSSTGGNAGALPATGDTAPVTAVVLLGMLALAGTSVLVRRRIRRR